MQLRTHRCDRRGPSHCYQASNEPPSLTPSRIKDSLFEAASLTLLLHGPTYYIKRHHNQTQRNVIMGKKKKSGWDLFVPRDRSRRRSSPDFPYYGGYPLNMASQPQSQATGQAHQGYGGYPLNLYSQPRPHMMSQSTRGHGEYSLPSAHQAPAPHPITSQPRQSMHFNPPQQNTQPPSRNFAHHGSVPRPGWYPEGATLSPGMYDPLASRSTQRTLGHNGQFVPRQGMSRMEPGLFGIADDPRANYEKMKAWEEMDGSRKSAYEGRRRGREGNERETKHGVNMVSAR